MSIRGVIVLLGAGVFVAMTAESRSADWKPAQGRLMTRWAAEVSTTRVHPEYPRPQLVRKDWVNLNGIWDYAIRPGELDRPVMYDGQILVPFPVESSLSGVMKPVKPDQRLWYRRSFPLKRTGSKRWLLHFGAVDWDTTVYLNGKKLGQHRGGFDPFTFDITDALTEGESPQELVVSVWDPTDSKGQPRGKQVLKPGGIMYTANTGIWQTVWLEPVPTNRIEALKIVPNVDESTIRVEIQTVGQSGKVPAQFVVRDGAKVVASTSTPAAQSVTLLVPDAKLWSPDRPFLYDLVVSLGEDEVASYFGMRKISVAKDRSGTNLLFLNNKPLFQLGPLDQGWWPDGLYTAPSDEALRYDIEITKRLGFNMIRKHVKVEPERWYTWCDRLGMLVWQDMPSGDNKDDEARRQFHIELERMIEARWNHPSIVMWVPFNEGWGQHDTPRYVDWIKKFDPSRLVNNASGWTDTRTGDVSDVHSYPGPAMPATEPGRVAVLGEFGGLGLPLEGHVWVDKDNWGYRRFKDFAGLEAAYRDLYRRLQGLRMLGLGAAVYTQTTDVEVEVNGLLTYDRAVLKIPVEILSSAHKPLYDPVPSARTLVPTAQAAPQPWKFTLRQPAEGWTRNEFDDRGWSSGRSGFGSSGTPGALIHTEWKSSDIWLRREFELKSPAEGSPWLIVHHDEDAEIWINGQSVARLPGHTSSYAIYPLEGSGSSLLRPGRNSLAVHCRQTRGGQYIDVGIVEVPMETSNASGRRDPSNRGDHP